MKAVVLLFHENHFAQILPFFREYPASKLVFIPLDIYSLKCLEGSPYRLILPKYKDKVLIRRELLRRIPFIIREWGDVCIGGKRLKAYLKIKDFNLWEILKSELGIALFDKMYFLELVKMMLSRSGGDHLILPKSPPTIQLSYSTAVDYRTIKNLAESMGIPVINKIKL